MKRHGWGPHWDGSLPGALHEPLSGAERRGHEEGLIAEEHGLPDETAEWVYVGLADGAPGRRGPR
jgi:hypothetical protein